MRPILFSIIFLILSAVMATAAEVKFFTSLDRNSLSCRYDTCPDFLQAIKNQGTSDVIDVIMTLVYNGGPNIGLDLSIGGTSFVGTGTGDIGTSYWPVAYGNESFSRVGARASGTMAIGGTLDFRGECWSYGGANAPRAFPENINEGFNVGNCNRNENPISLTWSFGVGAQLYLSPGVPDRVSASHVPLPTSLPLIATGIGLLGLAAYRRNRRKTGL